MRAGVPGRGVPMTPLSFTYKNWRGEVSVRRVHPISVRFGTNDWHKEPQWLMLATDTGKNEEREFAMQDMACWGTLRSDNFGFV